MWGENEAVLVHSHTDRDKRLETIKKSLFLATYLKWWRMTGTARTKFRLKYRFMYDSLTKKEIQMLNNKWLKIIVRFLGPFIYFRSYLFVFGYRQFVHKGGFLDDFLFWTCTVCLFLIALYLKKYSKVYLVLFVILFFLSSILS